MKLKVRIEFDIEGNETPDQDSIKEMVHYYLSEAIENDELEYEVFSEDEEEY